MDTYSTIENILRCLSGQSFEDFWISLLVDFRGICVSSLVDVEARSDKSPVPDRRMARKTHLWQMDGHAEEKSARTRCLYGKRQEKTARPGKLISDENPRDFLVSDIFTS